MGWASGSGILTAVWNEVREYVPEYEREEVLLNLMHLFAQYDCDTLGEVVCDKWPESAGAYEAFFNGDD